MAPHVRSRRALRQRPLATWTLLGAAAGSWLLAGGAEGFAGFVGWSPLPTGALRTALQSALARRAQPDGEAEVGKAPPAVEAAAAAPRRASSARSRLMGEVMGSTPGLARSVAADPEAQSQGGVMLFVAPERTQSVAFALWFGPLPCFQVGTFRICL